MFSITRSLPLLLMSGLVGLAQVAVSLPIHYQASFDMSTFHVSTPDTLHQCTPALFAWTPTTGPYYLTVTSSSSSPKFDDFDVDDDDIIVIPHATSASWIVDATEGQRVILQVRDSEGRVAETMTRTVKSGPSHCL